MATKPKPLTALRKTRDARHILRWMRSEAGATPAEIAKLEGVSERSVRESIEQIGVYKEQNTELMLQVAVRDLIISSIPQAQETLDGLLRAKTVISVKNKNTGQNEDVEVEDKITRLEAMRVVKELYSSTMPKAPGVALQVNQNNTPQNLAPTVGRGETPEERMRRIRNQQMQHNLLPPEVAGVPKHIDAGYDPDDPENEKEEYLEDDEDESEQD